MTNDELRAYIIGRDGSKIAPFGDDISEFKRDGVGTEIDHVFSQIFCLWEGVEKSVMDHPDNRQLSTSDINRIKSGSWLLSDLVNTDLIDFSKYPMSWPMVDLIHRNERRALAHFNAKHRRANGLSEVSLDYVRDGMKQRKKRESPIIRGLEDEFWLKATDERVAANIPISIVETALDLNLGTKRLPKKNNDDRFRIGKDHIAAISVAEAIHESAEDSAYRLGEYISRKTIRKVKDDRESGEWRRGEFTLIDYRDRKKLVSAMRSEIPEIARCDIGLERAVLVDAIFGWVIEESKKSSLF